VEVWIIIEGGKKMKKLKFYVPLMVLILAIGYWGLFSQPIIDHKPVLRYPHVVLKANVDVREIGSMDFRCYDENGKLKWEELDRQNNLGDEGEYMFLDVVLRAGSAPSTYYLRLYNATPTDTSNLTSISTLEPTVAGTTGYFAQTVARNTTGWPTLGLDAGDYQATCATQTFTATGVGWGPVTYCVLATSTDSTGKLVSYVALSQSRTLAIGESLQVTYKLKLQ
jgi:hypothetical protein